MQRIKSFLDQIKVLAAENGLEVVSSNNRVNDLVVTFARSAHGQKTQSKSPMSSSTGHAKAMEGVQEPQLPSVASQRAAMREKEKAFAKAFRIPRNGGKFWRG